MPPNRNVHGRTWFSGVECTTEDAVKERLYLAVDIGAGSGRLVAGRLRDGKLKLAEVSRFDNPLREHDGFLRWDLDGLAAAVRRGVRSMRAAPSSLGVDTWAVDFVLVGTDGEPVEPARAYRNLHTRDAVRTVHEAVGEARLYAVTGIQTQHFNSIYQLAAWKAQGARGWDRVRTFAMAPDWIAHRLGAPLATELSNASTTQLVDARTGDWSPELLDAVGIPRSWFSRPLAPGNILAERVELEGHPLAIVAPATHDTGSAVAAIPLRGERSAYISSGTWCLVGVELPAPETSEAARAANFTNEAGVDGTSRFLKNCMGLWLLQGLKNSWGAETDFAAMIRAAEHAPAFEAPFDVDDARFFQPESMTVAIESWWTDHGAAVPARDLGRYVRACLEGLVLAFRRILREIESIRGVSLESLHIVGGGSQNSLLCQWTADATGLTVLAGPVEASALGNVMVQARALGDVADTREARAVIERSFAPVVYLPRDAAPWERAARRLESQISQGVSS
jgi:rhamnulokinase